MQKIGVIVARFQGDNLTEGHRDLIFHVNSKSDKIVFIIGEARVKLSGRDPLDFISRREMVIDFCKINEIDAEVYPQLDQRLNEVWSENLDKLLESTHKYDIVTLYGSRDCFIKHYKGKFDTEVFESPRPEVSATEMRKQLLEDIKTGKVKIDSSFRRGYIACANNRYPIVFPVVDIALLRFLEGSVEILIGRKPNENLWRLPGGFVDGTDKNLFAAALRELKEECGSLTTKNHKYIDSFIVDDWRYRGREDKIMTSLISMEYVSGTPMAGDDLVDVKWVNIKKLGTEEIVTEHHILVQSIVDQL